MSQPRRELFWSAVATLILTAFAVAWFVLDVLSRLDILLGH